MNQLKMGSLFDGSAGFPLAAVMYGIQAVWASEIEPYPIRVTTKRLPFMKHYGDISKLNGAEIEPVDIITGGSPCQDMSVEGKRAGLDGARSGLFRQQIRVIKEMRETTNGKYPRYMVWENVPGALSSNKGQDFRCVLEETARIKATGFDVPMPEKNKWSTAGLIVDEEAGFSIGWRILDAQYWGVPQRRRRIFLVADFGGTSSEEILFKREGLSWHFAQSRETWQTATGNLKESINETGKFDGEQYAVDFGRTADRIQMNATKATTLLGLGGGAGAKTGLYCLPEPITMQIRCGCEGGGKGALIQENLSATLGCNNNQTLFQPRAYGICAKDSNSMKSSNPNSGFYEAETSRCLDANGGNPSCNQGGIAVIEGNGSRPSHKGDGFKESDVMYTLNATEQHGVCYPQLGSGKDTVGTLMANAGTKLWLGNQEAFSGDYSIIEPNYIVRRLIPLECARLQGFPDWWCDGLAIEEPSEDDIAKWRDIFETHAKAIGKSTKPKTDNQIRKWLQNPQSDSAEYKMWGNGVALPCVLFVMEGIAEVMNKEK